MNEPAGLVTIVAREDRADELLDLLGRMARVAVRDEGTEIYAIHRSRQNVNTFLIYELYRDKDSLKRHQANAELGELAPKWRT